MKSTWYLTLSFRYFVIFVIVWPWQSNGHWLNTRRTCRYTYIVFKYTNTISFTTSKAKQSVPLHSTLPNLYWKLTSPTKKKNIANYRMEMYRCDCLHTKSIYKQSLLISGLRIGSSVRNWFGKYAVTWYCVNIIFIVVSI